jgi:N-acetyl-anhydromuramyl-L-alanine amidase AmpD
MANPKKWNELVPEGNRLASPNRNARRPMSLDPTHIVIHVTGTDDVSSVRQTFLAKDSVSAHYLVAKDGELFQFVVDADRAWHAGIDSTCRALYRKGGKKWRRYLKYFSWYANYTKDAVFVDGDLKPVWDSTEAVFVARADGQEWPQYDYLAARWGSQEFPVNYFADSDPNNYSIGIETMGFGSRLSDGNVYTAAMYSALKGLIQDLSAKYSIPMKRGRVVGHEDVNPLARFGWDPAQGFDWAKILD